ncbi:GxxExxY protein [Ferruginibacter sp. SUN106]|uniref:GxxExxY protein n=1 Tax=Ferruginibacter sp. SUN106 TaxID=2978348 RepID=UPI003D35C322
MYKITKKFMDQLSYEIIGAAMEVHKEMGPGLLESVYQACMQEELKYREIPFKSEMTIPVIYRSKNIETFLRCDFFVDDLMVVELKAVEKVLPIHEAQLITYMKLLKISKGVIINFNVTNIFKEGQKTFVNEHYRDLPDF